MVVVCYKGKYFMFLNGYLYCPPGLFVLCSNVTTRINHPKQLSQPFAKTSALFNSFFLYLLLSYGMPYLLRLCLTHLLVRLKIL